MRWLIYPYSPKFIPVIRYGKLSENDCITSVAAPTGFALEGKSVYVWEDSGKLKIQNEKDVMASEYDGVWITPEIAFIPEKEMTERLNELLLCDKYIYYSAILSKEKERQLMEFFEKKEAKKIIHRKSLMYDFEWQSDNTNMYKFDVPIIMVAGIGKNSQKFEIQLYLRNQFQEMGYKVSQIGTRPYCEMLDFHSMPEGKGDSF